MTAIAARSPAVTGRSGRAPPACTICHAARRAAGPSTAWPRDEKYPASRAYRSRAVLAMRNSMSATIPAPGPGASPWWLPGLREACRRRGGCPSGWRSRPARRVPDRVRFHGVDMAGRGPARSAASSCVEGIRRTLGDHLDGAVRTIGDPAPELQATRRSLHEPAESDALHRAPDDGVQPFARASCAHRASLRPTPALVRGQRSSRSSSTSSGLA